MTRPRLCGELYFFRGGGGSEAKTKFYVPKIDLQFRTLLINFFFFPEETFSGLGGGVGQVEERRLHPTPPGMDALEGKGRRRPPQKRLFRRLQEVAKVVGGGYCRLQMPLSLALAVRGTVAGHTVGALQCIPPLPPVPLSRGLLAAHSGDVALRADLGSAGACVRGTEGVCRRFGDVPKRVAHHYCGAGKRARECL